MVTRPSIPFIRRLPAPPFGLRLRLPDLRIYGDTPVNSYYPPPPSSAFRLAPALAWREALAEARFNGGESSARRTTRSRIAHRRRQKIDEVHNALEDWTDDRPPVVARRQMGHHACDDILVKAGGITGTGFELHNFLIRG